MRLTCEVAVINRNQLQQRSRPLKSTISIGYNSRDDKKAEMFLLHENLLNKSGQRYRLFALMNVLRKGLCDGANDVKSNSSMTQSTLNAKKRPLLTKSVFSLKNHVNDKMIIEKRSDLDKGIQRTVKDLTISDLGLYRFPTNILRLPSLSTINLSRNNLTEIPAGFGSLPLSDINFSENQLTRSNFAWLRQFTIQMSLKSINLSRNQLRHFPASILKIPNLRTIKLSNNKIQRIPFAIRTLKNLRELHVNENKLESLPDALRWISFDNIDISGNFFKGVNEASVTEVKNRIVNFGLINLTEMCLRRVVQFKLTYTPATLPRSLIDLLDESPLCPCGNICLSTFVVERWHEAKIVSKSINYELYQSTQFILFHLFSASIGSPDFTIYHFSAAF
ncbi:Leucine-rich repeat protein 1, partial [Pseudolycoriella hygida]